jgi:hypothetical protein
MIFVIHSTFSDKERQDNTRYIPQQTISLVLLNGFFYGAIAPSGSQPPYYLDFIITPRHTTLGRIPLDE